LRNTGPTKLLLRVDGTDPPIRFSAHRLRRSFALPSLFSVIDKAVRVTMLRALAMLSELAVEVESE
jgi:hypothetical protein